eukprot:10437239-Karenia_brevis.AAC.1
MESVCKSHRLTIRASYGAELLAASYGLDDAYPTIITAVELRDGVLWTGNSRDFVNMEVFRSRLFSPLMLSQSYGTCQPQLQDTCRADASWACLLAQGDSKIGTSGINPMV